MRAAVSHFVDLKIQRVDRECPRNNGADDARDEGGRTLERFKERRARIYGAWSPDQPGT